jgi:hypothetical protein
LEAAWTDGQPIIRTADLTMHGDQPHRRRMVPMTGEVPRQTAQTKQSCIRGTVTRIGYTFA